MAIFIAETPTVRRTRRRPSDLPYLLINPPLTDPTQPYHSISYLVGAARAAGFTGERCVDANIDALNHLAHPHRVGALLDGAAKTRTRIEALSRLTRLDELTYRAALAAETLTADSVREAIQVFRNAESFYHYPTYRQAVMVMKLWQELLCLEGVPKSIADFSVMPGGTVNLSSYQDLCDPALIDRLTAPFDPYITGPFADVIRERPWRVVGFSVSFTGQLPAALRLARQTRAAIPDAVIVFGGTEVCDDVRLARRPGDYWELFRDADIIVPGEGESAFCGILSAVRDGRDFGGIPGILRRGEAPQTPPIHYEDVAELPAPAYDVWQWDSYWSPEPVVLYSPTRGCYWNKCTFCDYGLNLDRPTSPSRERPVAMVLEDLRKIADIGRSVYFSVDAMSPRYLRQLCDAMAGSRLHLRWSAELRLERTFPKRDMARQLRNAGCVAISFGYESGSQRVLDLIDKGVDLAQVPAILAHLADHRIGVQMMGFTGFPTERPDEARQTYDFLIEHRDHWALAAIGAFVLTPGSIVAKRPEEFGAEILPLPPTQDIQRWLPWRDRQGQTDHWPGDDDGHVGHERRSALKRAADDRPFVGGIDAAHTLLYFARFGPKLGLDGAFGEPHVRLAEIAQLEIPFANIEDFTNLEDVQSEYSLRQRQAGATSASIGIWLNEPGQARRGTAKAVVMPSGTVLLLRDEELLMAADHLQKLLGISARIRGDA
ncbi:B12-binding domain-containing radical SAM protein [Thermoactinospora rubra]|uniref:B12-binding domain-containing radical SAM protein n=1 Tax=Thermoactinospora rubra TaxID=1088767 RepID=UPI000A111E62|nr:radical SAM protein [Thermoactinospora rubra]